MKISHRKKSLCIKCVVSVIFILLVCCMYYYCYHNNYCCYKKELSENFFVSLFCSLLFFVFLNFFIRPRIKFGTDIRKVMGEDKCFFEYHIRNLSYWLYLKDIRVSYIINTPYGNKQKNHSPKDKLAFEAIGYTPYISYRDKEYNCIIIPYGTIKDYLKSKDVTYEHVLQKMVPDTPEQQLIGINLFLDKPDCTFQIVIHGYSSLTGVKKTYYSKEYKTEDIKIGDGWHRGKVVVNKAKRTIKFLFSFSW